MGKRVNYEIVGDGAGAAVVLFANNSHEDIYPDVLFVRVLSKHQFVSEAVIELLSARYPSDAGMHRAGQPIFTIDLDPGDREYVLRARVSGVIEGTPIELPRFERDNLDGTVVPIGSDAMEPLMDDGAGAPGL